jgi:hypothetical protein
MKINEIVTEAKKRKSKDPCWSGYEQIGMKEKNGKKVPNCVPKESEKLPEARKANTATARRELGKRQRREDPVQQDKKKQDSDEAWERLMQFAADHKKK